MKLKYEFVINQVADKMVAVPVGNDLETVKDFVGKLKEGGLVE